MCFGANFWHHANLPLLKPQKNGVGCRPKEKKREAKERKVYIGVDNRIRRKRRNSGQYGNVQAKEKGQKRWERRWTEKSYC